MTTLEILNNLNLRVNQKNIIKDIKQADSKGYKHVFIGYLFKETKKHLEDLGYSIKIASGMTRIEWK